MKSNPLFRLDLDAPESLERRQELLKYCRLKPGDIWEDPEKGHRIGCLDAANASQMEKLLGNRKAVLAIHDPPYNLVAFEERQLRDYIAWCHHWICLTERFLAVDAALYIWLGADQKNGFQPLPDFMIMMREISAFEARSFITLRNQRGYGTQKNWMAVRQELLYYTKGNPPFSVQYTDIPKILRGYYKDVSGKRQENLERGHAPNIRPGNVWVDIQQVFYRMHENVSGCYAQKPLKAIERIITASSKPGDLVLDFFAHSGTTLLASEILGRKCFTSDTDPIFCEVTLRRLEKYRKERNKNAATPEKSQLGWQNETPFPEVDLKN